MKRDCDETTSCYPSFVTRPSTTSQAILIVDQVLLGLADKLLPPNPSVSNPNNTYINDIYVTDVNQFYSMVNLLTPETFYKKCIFWTFW